MDFLITSLCFALAMTGASFLRADSLSIKEYPSLKEARKAGALNSSYRNFEAFDSEVHSPQADLETFNTEIWPILEQNCVKCHGPDKQKGDYRIDELDPDIVRGEDADWWLEIVDVLSFGEMPPEEEPEVPGEDIGKVMDWISSQAFAASQVERENGAHTSFRRMTRYEFSYALQDLLGLSHDLFADLPPEAVSEDGFLNSSEMLQMTSSQFGTYQDIAREALKSATVRGPRPKPAYFAITMERPVEHMKERAEVFGEIVKANMDAAFNPRAFELNYNRINRFLENKDYEKPFSESRTHFLHLLSGKGNSGEVPLGYGFLVWEPTDELPSEPAPQPYVMVLPHQRSYKLDLGEYLPESGAVKVRFRANRVSAEGNSYPSMRLSFGYQPTNDSRFSIALNLDDIAITVSRSGRSRREAESFGVFYFRECSSGREARRRHGSH